MNWKYHILTLLILSLLKPTEGFGQAGANIVVNNSFTGSTAMTPLLPDQMRINMPDEIEFANVEFFQLNYRTPMLDLRRIKAYKGVNIPDSVVIIPPDLSSFDHVVALIGVSDRPKSTGLVIWLAGDYNYKDVTFFVDYDQDRDFTNDKPPLHVRAGGRQKDVVISYNGGLRKLTIGVPEIKVKKKERLKLRIADRFAVALYPGVGTGQTSFEYFDTTIGYPTWYLVNITEKSLNAALTYDTKRFNVGVSVSFQNHFYFTSRLDIQQGEPFFLIDQNGFRILDDNILNLVNIDSHPTNRVQLGLFGSLKLKVSGAIDVLPTAKIGTMNYFNPEYNRFIHQEDQIYPIRWSRFYELGIKTEFTTGIAKAFFVEVAYNDQKWEPVGLLNDTPHTNFRSGSFIWKLIVGYRFGL